MVLVKEGDKVPMWATLDDMKKRAEPERQLERGDTVAIEKVAHVGQPEVLDHRRGQGDRPHKGSAMMGGGAEWHGIDLDDKTPLPFGWVTPDKANVYAAPPEKPAKGRRRMQLERRTRLSIVERAAGRQAQVAQGHRRRAAAGADASATSWPKRQEKPAGPRRASAQRRSAAGDHAGSAADAVNEVRLLEHPKTVRPTSTKWIDVDLGEQVLVAYENDKPVFATLVSSGRAIPTPMGTYPVWAKVVGDHDEEPALRGQGVLRQQGAVVDLLPVAQRHPRRLLARPLRRHARATAASTSRRSTPATSSSG